MECPFCEHPKAHKHSETRKGCQRYRCPSCQQTFTESLDTLYYRRQVTPAEIEDILQAQTEGVSLRGISRMSKRSYNTVVAVVRASSQKAQLVHNQEVKDVETDKVIADEMWSFVKKNCTPEELTQGDCWIGLSLAQESGLIIGMRVGKHTDQSFCLKAFSQESSSECYKFPHVSLRHNQLVVNTEGKTDCKVWYTDDWGGYERILPPEVTHIIGKKNTQRLERTNGIVRQQTDRWHRRQNKFGKRWEQAEVTARLAVSYFNWIWQHSRKKNTAA